MKRKTVDVAYLIETVNRVCRESGGSAEALGNRMGMCSLLEGVLMVSGNYKGFRYLTKDEVPQMCKPGINLITEPNTVEMKFKDTDDTRREYF